MIRHPKRHLIGLGLRPGHPSRLILMSFRCNYKEHSESAARKNQRPSQMMKIPAKMRQTPKTQMRRSTHSFLFYSIFFNILLRHVNPLEWIDSASTNH